MYSKPLTTCFPFQEADGISISVQSHLLKPQTRNLAAAHVSRARDCAHGIRDLSDVTIKSALNTRNDSKNDVFTLARLVDDS